MKPFRSKEYRAAERHLERAEWWRGVVSWTPYCVIIFIIAGAISRSPPLMAAGALTFWGLALVALWRQTVNYRSAMDLTSKMPPIEALDILLKHTPEK